MSKKNRPKPDWMFHQSAVIPYQIQNGVLEILLITSRKRSRWIIPKGIIEEDLDASSSAIKEAWEEAGITGRIVFDKPIGTYTYSKWGGTCHVEVFLFEVRTSFHDWPEALMRDREWVTIDEAIKRIDESALKNMLASIPDYLTNGL